MLEVQPVGSVMTTKITQTEPIVPLGEAGLGDALVGEQAARLGELARAGLPVPPGFVVTADALEEALADAGMIGAPEAEAVRSLPLSAALVEAVRHALATLDGPVAVRSSGLSEDRADASFAGQYETVLDVRGADAVLDAIRVCWASAFSPRVLAYRASLEDPGTASIAVLVQVMVPASAAGVAFCADPISGDRAVATVSAVRGLGDALVSGDAGAEEWAVRGGEPIRKRSVEAVLGSDEVLEVAALARRVQAHYGDAPQDIEWARTDDALYLLQARPMTALPEAVDWTPPVPGCWVRDFRLGEWLGGPATPLFATWAIPAIEGRMHQRFREIFGGMPMPERGHVFVNGWYFYGLDYMDMSPWALVRYGVPTFLLRFRRAAGLIPPIAHLGLDLWVEEWRSQTGPAYEAAVDAAAVVVRTGPESEIVAAIDELLGHAGEHLTSMTAVAGYAAKAEFPLAAFWREHVEPKIGVSVLEVVRGVATPEGPPAAHAVEDLDWFHPTLGERGLDAGDLATTTARTGRRLAARRDEVLAAAGAALAGSARKRRKLDALVAAAARGQRLREDQSAAFTRAWPVLRAGLRRLGEGLVARGALAEVDDVFFLDKTELVEALGSPGRRLAGVVTPRHHAWQRQRRLTPPLRIGRLPAQLEKGLAMGLEVLRTAGASERPGLHGLPASPGRVTGRARVVHGLDELDRLAPGEILVTRVTTPGWTPAFARAAAVVTDIGSLASHASIVAREFGIPAVVATQRGTALIHDGDRITVDGTAGVVEGERLDTAS